MHPLILALALYAKHIPRSSFLDLSDRVLCPFGAHSELIVHFRMENT